AVTDGKPVQTVLGAVLGGVGTAFAPTVLDRLRERDRAREVRDEAAELLPQMTGPAQLLHPARGVVPFVGRERELAELLAWCADPQAGRLRLLTGPGGVGKSRLAAELAARLGPEWGGLEVRDDSEAEALARWREADPRRPVLIVVDYAETRTGLAGCCMRWRPMRGGGCGCCCWPAAPENGGGSWAPNRRGYGRWWPRPARASQ